MKKTFAFLFLLLGFWHPEKATAQHSRGEIAVHSEDGEKLGIAVGGRRYDRFSPDFVLGNIPTGRRSITIYRLKPHRRDGGATAQTVYEGQLLIRPGYRVLLRVNAKDGAVSIQHQELSASPSYRQEVPSLKPPARTPPLALPQENHAQNDNQAGKSIPGTSNWHTQLQGKATDTEKLRILKARVSAQAVSAAELAEMMGTLAFEESRLDLAQAALPKLSDPENLPTVSAALERTDSRKILEASARRLR